MALPAQMRRQRTRNPTKISKKVSWVDKNHGCWCREEPDGGDVASRQLGQPPVLLVQLCHHLHITHGAHTTERHAGVVNHPCDTFRSAAAECLKINNKKITTQEKKERRMKERKKKGENKSQDEKKMKEK